MIKNVIFDIGGVLLDWNPLELLKSMFNEEIARTLKKQMMDTTHWADLDRGTLSIEEAVECFSINVPNLKDEIEYALNNFIEYIPVLDENVQILKELHKKGYNLYVLSNFQEESFEIARRKFDFFNLFDAMVISAHIKMIKPEPDIYEYILDKYSLNPLETVFFDDSEPNIEMAKKFNIHGVHTPSPKHLQDFYLRELNGGPTDDI